MPRLNLTAGIDIVLVACLIYQFFQIIRGRRAERILGGIILVMLVYLGSIYFAGVAAEHSGNAIPYTVRTDRGVQSEIRRVLARLGKARLFAFGSRMQTAPGWTGPAGTRCSEPGGRALLCLNAHRSRTFTKAACNWSVYFARPDSGDLSVRRRAADGAAALPRSDLRDLLLSAALDEPRRFPQPRHAPPRRAGRYRGERRDHDHRLEETGRISTAALANWPPG